MQWRHCLQSLIIAAVLGIAITVVAIVVELAANRYSHQITRLFLTAPNNLLVLSLYALTTIQCIWVGVILALSRVWYVFTLVITMTGLGQPDFSRCLHLQHLWFLSPTRLCADRCHHAAPSCESPIGCLILRQDAVETGIDELQDVARGAITHGDREIAMLMLIRSRISSSVSAIKQTLPEDWFRVSEE